MSILIKISCFKGFLQISGSEKHFSVQSSEYKRYDFLLKTDHFYIDKALCSCGPPKLKPQKYCKTFYLGMCFISKAELGYCLRRFCHISYYTLFVGGKGMKRSREVQWCSQPLCCWELWFWPPRHLSSEVSLLHSPYLFTILTLLLIL